MDESIENITDKETEKAEVINELEELIKITEEKNQPDEPVEEKPKKKKAKKKTTRKPKTLNWNIDEYKGRDFDYNTNAPNYVYITTPKELEACRRELSGQTRIALDIEVTGYVPNEEGDLPEKFTEADGAIRLIQIGIDEPMPKQFVIDCFKVNPLPILEFVWGSARSPRWPSNRETIIHYAWFEQAWLAYHYGVKLGKIFDTCAVARSLNKYRIMDDKLKDAKLLTVVDHYLEVELDKSQQASYWDSDVLAEEQIAYAALDVSTLLDLYPLMKAECIAYDITNAVDSSMRKMMQAAHWLGKREDKRSDERQRVERAIRASRNFEETEALYNNLGQIVLHYEDRYELMELCDTLKEKQLNEGNFDVLDANVASSDDDPDW